MTFSCTPYLVFVQVLLGIGASVNALSPPFTHFLLSLPFPDSFILVQFFRWPTSIFTQVDDLS